MCVDALAKVAFAVLACWTCTRPRWIRLLPLGVVLGFGLQDQQQLMGDNAKSIQRYDGVRAWLMSKGDAKPAKNRRGEVSASTAECPDGAKLAMLSAEEPSADRLALGAARSKASETLGVAGNALRVIGAAACANQHLGGKAV